MFPMNCDILFYKVSTSCHWTVNFGVCRHIINTFIAINASLNVVTFYHIWNPKKL